MMNIAIQLVLQCVVSPSNGLRLGACATGRLQKNSVHVCGVPDLVQQLLDRMGLRESIHDLYFDTKMAAELGELPDLSELGCDLELGGERDDARRRCGHYRMPVLAMMSDSDESLKDMDMEDFSEKLSRIGS